MTIKIRACIITASDRCARGEQEDKSGEALIELLSEMGAEIVATEILSDDLESLANTLQSYAERPDVNLIITTGGTGLSPRDNTPEATRRVIEREVPGIAEAMRIETRTNAPTAILSRGLCGVRAEALIINLPGSPKGVRECFGVVKPVLPHAIALIAGRPHSEA